MGGDRHAGREGDDRVLVPEGQAEDRGPLRVGRLRHADADGLEGGGQAIGLKGTKLGSAKATCDGHGRFTVKVKPNDAAEAALEDWRGSVEDHATLTLSGPIGQTTATRTINLKGKGRAR